MLHFIYDNRIDLNENKYVFKYLNEFLPSYDWLPYEYIDAEVKKKVDKTKGHIAGDEMEKETIHYVEYLNHYLNWLTTVTIEIDKFLIDLGYIDSFMQMYLQLIKDNGFTSSFWELIIPHLPRFEKLALSQLKSYIETETMT